MLPNSETCHFNRKISGAGVQQYRNCPQCMSHQSSRLVIGFVHVDLNDLSKLLLIRACLVLGLHLYEFPLCQLIHAVRVYFVQQGRIKTSDCK